MTMRESQKETDNKIKSGAFDCPWQGRDEIRDLLETQRNVVSTMTTLVDEMKQLTTELRLTRNGRKGGPS